MARGDRSPRAPHEIGGASLDGQVINLLVEFVDEKGPSWPRVRQSSETSD